jgi:hypothetical protein
MLKVSGLVSGQAGVELAQLEVLGAIVNVTASPTVSGVNHT